VARVALPVVEPGTAASGRSKHQIRHSVKTLLASPGHPQFFLGGPVPEPRLRGKDKGGVAAGQQLWRHVVC